jgi:hypothetical protein
VTILISKDFKNLHLPGIWVYKEEGLCWVVDDRNDLDNPIPIADVYRDLDLAVSIARLYEDTLDHNRKLHSVYSANCDSDMGCGQCCS